MSEPESPAILELGEEAHGSMVLSSSHMRRDGTPHFGIDIMLLGNGPPKAITIRSIEDARKIVEFVRHQCDLFEGGQAHFG